MSGVTGLYFMVENDEPTTMDYEDDEAMQTEWLND